MKLDSASSMESLCKQYTNLTPDDVLKLKEVAASIQLMADLNQSNIFIDCLTKEGTHAIVVAEAAPSISKTLYKNSVVGKFAYDAFEPGVVFTLKTGKHMLLNRAITQECKTVEQSVMPIKNSKNKVIGTLIMEKDISDQVSHQRKLEALSEATEKLSGILIGMAENRPIISEVIEEALFFIDGDRKVLYCNPPATNLVLDLCDKKCIAGTPLTAYLPSLEELINHSEELLVKEIKISNRFYQVKKIDLGSEEKPTGTFIIMRDMTELREKERELIVKSVAIREIHHRVKNNLQTVASLLRLQMRREVPEESKIHFIKSLNRILSIASVYEIILSSSSVDEVDLHSLIEKIGNMIVYGEEHDNKEISIVYEGSRMLVNSSKAVSMALVINELIQNCIKHAFKNQERGQIKVSFDRIDQDLEVVVNDDGAGYSKDAKHSFGLEIVKMMVEHDLGGQFTIDRTENGTCASVKFQIERQGDRS
ncbi:histidine kinase N-terminal domain-containing protein [Mesobacillus subterraneus]|uniref:sensor histidine kinase n=1 Tax=Mesobacillus subterraneus TaxID=285983 RepID=UPI0020426B6C|nr:sensor histidine kinase [Mesobacillus subterraneus]MCM3572301.1 histidine kinase N-terminal domain-containing protein [Mesobacillus subterraneus]